MKRLMIEFYEGLEDIDWNDGWSEVSEPCCNGDNDFVKGLEDIDWDENWSEAVNYAVVIVFVALI